MIKKNRKSIDKRAYKAVSKLYFYSPSPYKSICSRFPNMDIYRGAFALSLASVIFPMVARSEGYELLFGAGLGGVLSIGMMRRFEFFIRKKLRGFNVSALAGTAVLQGMQVAWVIVGMAACIPLNNAVDKLVKPDIAQAKAATAAHLAPR